MREVDLLTHIAERAEVSEEETERVLEVVIQDLAASLRERRGKPLAVEVPPYFDRYVTAEINRVSGQISDLREEVNRRFAELREDMDYRFDRVDRWFLGAGVPIILGILAIIVKVFFGP